MIKEDLPKETISCPQCGGSGEYPVTHGGMCDCWRCQGEGAILSQYGVYRTLFGLKYAHFLEMGHTEDKASRLANIYCVKNTWRVFNDQENI